jgi:6-phosphogluconolactonase
MNIIEYADREMAAIDLANVLADDLKTALDHSGRASLVVPGGTTPGPVFDSLCAADLDWSRVSVIASDERCVPMTSSRSNAKLISERLLTGRAAVARYVPLYLPAPTPEDILPSVQSDLAPDLPISVLLLGMGADMHTASLFPGVDGLQAALEPDAPPLAVMRPDSQPEARISFSAPYLNGAINKHLVIFGRDKQDALLRAQSLPPEEAPINAVLSGMTVHWAP